MPPPAAPARPAPAAPAASPPPAADLGGTIDFSRYRRMMSERIQGTTVIGAGAKPPVGAEPGRRIVSRRTGREAAIDKAEFALGRDPKWADFAVPDNSNVSSAHAIIRRVGSQYFIMDTNSTNHVTLNGRRIPPNQDTPMNPGAVFVLGDEEFDFL
jgi:hypothetical protein